MTEAEQNQLIIEHMDTLVPAIAAGYRGGEVEWDDLLSAGREGLIKAARTYDPGKALFSTWATIRIKSAIKHAVDTARSSEDGSVSPGGGDSIEKIFDWDAWGDLGNANAIAERWSMLDASPEELSILHQDIEDKRSKFEAAFISLSGAQRKLIRWVYLSEPRKPIVQAARDLGVSYSRAIGMLKKALRTMRKVIERMETNKKPLRGKTGGTLANGLPSATGLHGYAPGVA